MEKQFKFVIISDVTKYLYLSQTMICNMSETQTARKIKDFKDNIENAKTESPRQKQSCKTKREGFGGIGNITIFTLHLSVLRLIVSVL